LFLTRPATRSSGALVHAALPAHVDPDRPVYAFLNRPFVDAAPPYASIEEMAVEYMAAMREVQPRGPYLLGGWSLGGLTAFEMANRLAAEGEAVARLVLFDVPAPQRLYQRLRFFARNMLARARLRAGARFPRLARHAPWIQALRAPSLMLRFGGLAYMDPDND